MSVTGEFRRLVGDCAAFLEDSDAAGARKRADALRGASALAANDLSAAAERVLAFADSCEGQPPIEFATPAERDEFDRLFRHAIAITRSLLGKPEV